MATTQELQVLQAKGHDLKCGRRPSRACRSLALDAACRAIQEALGVQYGDTAGAFFAGDDGDQVRETLISYIRLEGGKA
jgi:hypothetical protein